jgi:hypothetical protein
MKDVYADKKEDQQISQFKTSYANLEKLMKGQIL